MLSYQIFILILLTSLPAHPLSSEDAFYNEFTSSTTRPPMTLEGIARSAPHGDTTRQFRSADGRNITITIYGPRLFPPGQNRVCGVGTYTEGKIADDQNQFSVHAIKRVSGTGQNLITEYWRLSGGRPYKLNYVPPFLISNIQPTTIQPNPAGHCSLFPRNKDANEPSIDYFAVQLAIAKISNSTDVLFPNATYIFDDTGKSCALRNGPEAHIQMLDLEDVVVDLNGSVLQFTNPLSHGIKMYNLKRVVLKNGIIDWNRQLATTGRLERLPSSHPMGYQLTLSPSAQDISDPANPNIPLITSISSAGSNGRWFTDGATKVAHATAIRLSDSCDAPSVSFSRSTPPNGPISYTSPRGSSLSPLFPTPESTSVPVIVRHYNHDGLGIFLMNAIDKENLDVAIDRLTFHRVPGAILNLNRVRGLMLTNNRLIPRPGEAVSATAGGINATSYSDVVIENNHFSGQGDDSINLHSRYQKIVGITSVGSSTTCMDMGSYGVDYRVGDRVGLFSTSLSYEGVTDATGFRRYNLRPGDAGYPCGSLTQCANVCLRNIPGMIFSINKKIANSTLAMTRFLIRNNHFSNHQGRGILVQASNGLVDNNTVNEVTGSGIHLTSDYIVYMDGVGANNVILKDNIVWKAGIWDYYLNTRGVAHGGISIAAVSEDANGNPVTGSFKSLQHIRIEGSKSFVGYTGSVGLQLGSVKHLQVSQLKLGPTGLSSIQDIGKLSGSWAEGAVLVGQSANLDLRGLSNATGYSERSITVDLESTRFLSLPISSPGLSGDTRPVHWLTLFRYPASINLGRLRLFLGQTSGSLQTQPLDTLGVTSPIRLGEGTFTVAIPGAPLVQASTMSGNHLVSATGIPLVGLPLRILLRPHFSDYPDASLIFPRGDIAW